MKSVNIAKFKAELSKYLGYVRHGEDVVVFDRSEPLAKVIPFKRQETTLLFEEPICDPKNLMKLHYKPLSNQKTDSLIFLLEERDFR